MRRGFRRSGVFTYRPYCDTCNACVPVRIPVQQFNPDCSQRRARKVTKRCITVERPLAFIEEHYRLYQRYQGARHSGRHGSRQPRAIHPFPAAEPYVDTRLIEFRDESALRMVSVIDRLEDGLSSVYTFYDPALPGRRLRHLRHPVEAAHEKRESVSR